MNILSFTDAEKYLINKQVYFMKEIANSDLKTIAKADKVHNVGKVEITRLNDNTISIYIGINNEMANIYEYKTDLELFAWIRTNFIPVNELVNKWLS